jgi:hypothetical protein
VPFEASNGAVCDLEFHNKVSGALGGAIARLFGAKINISLAQSAPTQQRHKPKHSELPYQNRLFCSLSLATQVQSISTAIFDRCSADIC